MKIKPIEWTEPQKPAGVGDVPYDHVKGTCPLGEFLITWKSWKDYPSYCIDETPWNEWGGVAYTLEEAKQMAWDKYSEIIGACIEGAVGCYADDGYPIKCPECGHAEFTEKMRDFIDFGVGAGPATEIEYFCGSCGESVAYWAYGSFDPAYLDHKQANA